MEVRIKIVLFSHLSDLGEGQLSTAESHLRTEFCKYLIQNFKDLDQEIDPEKVWNEYLSKTNKKPNLKATSITSEKGLTIQVSAAHGKPGKLSKEDVWGEGSAYTSDNRGMIVARGLPDVDGKYLTQEEYLKLTKSLTNRCPVWGDILPYKSITFICKAEQVEQVTYWAEYVHGGGCISNIKDLPAGKVALRSNYMCW